LPNTYDFAAADSTNALPQSPVRTVGQGKYNGSSSNPVSNFSISPYVVADNVTDYGAGFSYAAATGVSTAAQARPWEFAIATACFACHDSALAMQHMESNAVRSTIRAAPLWPRPSSARFAIRPAKWRISSSCMRNNVIDV